MEFLTTPDLPARRLTRPLASSPPTTTSPHAPNAAATPATASSPAVPSLQTPSATPYPSTPYHAAAAPLDRAGIKNSFQSLFSPSPNAAAITPALLRPPSSAPGLTPFLAGLPTPALMMQNLMPPFVSLDQAQHQQQELLSSPFLQAAAKEAVRREFLNMPTYVSATPHAPPAPSTPSTSLPSYAGERAVPAPHASTSSTPQNQTTPQALASQSPASSNLSPGDAKVPNNVHLEQPSSSDNLPSTSQNLQSTAQSQPYFIPHPHPHQHPHVQPRVMMMGQHGPVMVPAPPHMYAPPHMMMFPSAQPFAPPPQQPGAPHQQPQPCLPQHHVFMPPHMAAHVPTVKLESQVDKKKSDETEKQDLIREFKKKTREAALVRFRQKRRDRRFGKLIRYDCRKKLADARPRVKGRFVRIKEDEEEGPQVVPDMEDR